MKNQIFIIILFLVFNQVSNQQLQNDCIDIGGILDGPNCQANGGKCAITSQGEIICVLSQGCVYSLQKKGCVNLFGLCEDKKGCCSYKGAVSLDGMPICQCDFNIPEDLCPKCLDEANSGICKDEKQICLKLDRCCQIKKIYGEKQIWDLCFCDFNKGIQCQTCSFDGIKGECIDVNNKCQKKGKCCLDNGMKVCGCTDCPPPNHCQYNIQTKTCQGQCIDSTQCCQQTIDPNGNPVCKCSGCPPPNHCQYNIQTKTCQGQCIYSTQCCSKAIDPTGNLFCSCSQCIPSNQCQYDSLKRICTGSCQFDNQCCQVVAYHVNGFPICGCLSSLISECKGGCQWSSSLGSCISNGQCQRVLGKCCKLNKLEDLCVCQETCKYNPLTKSCENNCCPQGHKCIIAKTINGINCQCI